MLTSISLFSMQSEQPAIKRKLPITPTVKIGLEDHFMQYDPSDKTLSLIAASPSSYTSKRMYCFKEHHVLNLIDEIEPQGFISLPEGTAGVILAKHKISRDSIALFHFSDDNKPVTPKGHVGLCLWNDPKLLVTIQKISFHETLDNRIKITLLVKQAKQLGKMCFSLAANFKSICKTSNIITTKLYNPVNTTSSENQEEKPSQITDQSCINKVD